MLGLCMLAVAAALDRPASTTVHTKLRAHSLLRAHRAGVTGGLPIMTCGGTQDMNAPEDQRVRMEVEHGKPCKFPFVYKDVEYNNCTEVDSGGVGAWCRTEFPDEGEDGPIRWAICNPKGEHCPSNPVDEGRDAA